MPSDSAWAAGTAGGGSPDEGGVVSHPVLGQRMLSAAPLRSPPHGLASLRAFVTLVEKTLRARMVYGIATLLSVLASAAGYCIFLLVWSEVYRQRSGAPALPSAQIFPYLVTAFVLNFTLASSLESRAGLRIMRGFVSVDLSKPMGFMPWHLAQALGDLVGNALLALPLAAVGSAALGHGLAPPSASAGLLGLGSLLLGFLVNFSMGFLIIQAFFVTDSYYGVAFTRTALHGAFSGLSAPLALFPEPLRSIAAYLPFRHVIETPARVWLGQIQGLEALRFMSLQALWIAVLLPLACGVFRVALRRVQIQGG
ncbi:MAG TPA: ABC-2 family transporter protein [Polyangiaceae bacterium]|nr:ABC-2 family transporter protein [Polyangiaceae bacterium]